MPHDLVIRGGLIVDGLGGEPMPGDVAVDDGIITHVGSVNGGGTEEIDATDQLVTPGFVDIHTHYDGQVTWDSSLAPSTWHGVTTAVMGNCGVGFAPVHPDAHRPLIELMEGVEDIPGAVLDEGISWEWESFGDYLDAVARLPHEIDIGAQLPHGALRHYVMGERAVRLEEATEEDMATMRTLAADAMRAGALGFTTSPHAEPPHLHRRPHAIAARHLARAGDDRAGLGRRRSRRHRVDFGLLPRPGRRTRHHPADDTEIGSSHFGVAGPEQSTS